MLDQPEVWPQAYLDKQEKWVSFHTNSLEPQQSFINVSNIHDLTISFVGYGTTKRKTAGMTTTGTKGQEDFEYEMYMGNRIYVKPKA